MSDVSSTLVSKYAGSCLVRAGTEQTAASGWLMLVKIFLYMDTSTFIKLGMKKPSIYNSFSIK